MASTREDHNMVGSYLKEEKKLGRVVGPLDSREFACVQTSPIGLILKDSSRKWRIIFDLSSQKHKGLPDAQSL